MIFYSSNGCTFQFVILVLYLFSQYKQSSFFCEGAVKMMLRRINNWLFTNVCWLTGPFCCGGSQLWVYCLDNLLQGVVLVSKFDWYNIKKFWGRWLIQKAFSEIWTDLVYQMMYIDPMILQLDSHSNLISNLYCWTTYHLVTYYIGCWFPAQSNIEEAHLQSLLPWAVQISAENCISWISWSVAVA